MGMLWLAADLIFEGHESEVSGIPILLHFLPFKCCFSALFWGGGCISFFHMDIEVLQLGRGVFRLW